MPGERREAKLSEHFNTASPAGQCHVTYEQAKMEGPGPGLLGRAGPEGE